MLYCICGATKDLHRHVWERKVELVNPGTTNLNGYILRCTTCGDMKSFKV